MQKIRKRTGIRFGEITNPFTFAVILTIPFDFSSVHITVSNEI